MENKDVRKALNNYAGPQLVDDQAWQLPRREEMMAAPAYGGPPMYEEATTQVEFKVTLTDFGNNKINSIKVVREITGMGLKEAKDVVESLPQVIANGVTNAVAADILNKFAEIGVLVTIE